MPRPDEPARRDVGPGLSPPPRLTARHLDPDPTVSALVDPIDLSPADLADLVFHSVVAGAGSWSIGVHGAIAEFVPDLDTAVRRTASTIEAVGPTGAIRLTIDERIRAFAVADSGHPSNVASVILTTPRAHDDMAGSEQTRLGIDPAPIRRGDADAAYFDLRIGHQAATFAVRTADPELIASLRSGVGLPWRAIVERDGGKIISKSPHRVLASAVGRIEVYAPIPPPGGRSPLGCHTHLLPAELELGRELPLGVILPPGFMPAATFHPKPDKGQSG